jgi:uncharacterized protein (DUF4415 family)
MKKRKTMPNPDAPLTAKEMEEATWMHGIEELPAAAQIALKKAIGRPRVAKPKQVISFRFDMDIIDHLKQDVSGYNTRVEQMLREAMEQGRL